MWNSIKNKKVLNLFDESMTRFLLDVEDAVNLIFQSVKYSNCNLIPVAKSFKIKDLFEIYSENFGLLFNLSKPRTGEKIHEIMASTEELRRMEFASGDNIYLLHPKKEIDDVAFINGEYSSRDYTISKEELFKYLKSKNFYR